VNGPNVNPGWLRRGRPFRAITLALHPLEAGASHIGSIDVYFSSHIDLQPRQYLRQ
jgi:hypothetical protein